MDYNLSSCIISSFLSCFQQVCPHLTDCYSANILIPIKICIPPNLQKEICSLINVNSLIITPSVGM